MLGLLSAVHLDPFLLVPFVWPALEYDPDRLGDPTGDLRKRLLDLDLIVLFLVDDGEACGPADRSRERS